MTFYEQSRLAFVLCVEVYSIYKPTYKTVHNINNFVNL